MIQYLADSYTRLMHRVRPRRLARWESAGILLTYRCNAACAHCYENSGPRKRAVMPIELLRDLLREFKKLGFSGRELHFAGGEPFFDYKHLIACFEVAKQEGMLPLGKLETNGFWCKSDAVARERLGAIGAFGIDMLLISCDPFHQEFVPIDCVKRALRVGREVLGEHRVQITPRNGLDHVVDVQALTPDQKRETFRALLEQRPMRMVGRAAESLASLVESRPKQSFANARCGRKLLWKRSVHVDPHGNVFPSVCAGIAIGNAAKTPLSEIYQSFDVREHPLVETLVERGPLPLLDEAILAGCAERKEGYTSKCHLCFEARRFFWQAGLRGDEVAPAEIYTD